VAVTALATKVDVLNDNANPLVVAKLLVVALTAFVTSVPVLNQTTTEPVDVLTLVPVPAVSVAT
jgi:hypothetical protein